MTIATPERFEKYQIDGKSATMMDHFYDKLLHLRIITGIEYIDKLMEERHWYMVNYVVEFWNKHK
jgi:HD superfamily phosphodiesterase